MANAAQMRTLIGRDAELERVEEFLGAIGSGPAALLIEGEAGIGKTTLFDQGLVSAAADGQRVLRCRPGERETQHGLRGARRSARRCPRDRHGRSARAAATCARGGAAARRARGGAVAAAGRRPRPARGAHDPGDRRADAACDRRRPVARPPVRERARVRGATPSGRAGRASSACAAAAAGICRSGSTVALPAARFDGWRCTASTRASSSCCCASGSTCRSHAGPWSACAA